MPNEFSVIYIVPISFGAVEKDSVDDKGSVDTI